MRDRGGHIRSGRTDWRGVLLCTSVGVMVSAPPDIVSDIEFFQAPVSMTGVALSGSSAITYGVNGSGPGGSLGSGETMTLTFDSAKYPAGK